MHGILSESKGIKTYDVKVRKETLNKICVVIKNKNLVEILIKLNL